MNELRWEDPPPSKRTAQWAEIVPQLVDRPQEWALVYEQADDESRGDAESRRVGIQSWAARRAIRVQVRQVTVDGRVRIYAKALAS